MHELFTKQAIKTPNKIAIIDNIRGNVIYKDMLNEVNLLASWLRYNNVGIGLNGVVGILSSTNVLTYSLAPSDSINLSI